MKKYLRVWAYFTFISAVLILFAGGAFADGIPTGDLSFHIVSTTDFHGHLVEQTNKAGIKIGGVPTMMGYFDIIKRQDPETLFLDSGDLFQGTLVSNLTDGASVIKFYNEVGYTAATIGNHDFDFGPGNGYSVAIKPGQDSLGALKAREVQANFPFISANICSLDEDKGGCQDVNTFANAKFSKPYLIKQVHGINVGIIGLTTIDTPEVTMAQNVSRLRFMPLVGTLQRFVPEMKSKGANAIVVIAHSGGYCQNGTCNPQDEIFSMIDGLDDSTRAAIAMVLAGHTHNYVNTVYHNVQLMITGAYGQSFGYLNLTYHGASKTVTVDSHQSIDFCQQVYSDSKNCFNGQGALVAPSFLGNPVVADTQALAVLQADLNHAQSVGAVVVGKNLSPLTKSNDTPESTLGDFMTDAYRFCYVNSSCSQKADIAFENNGGIRTSLISAGDIIYNQIFELQPFDNMIATAQMNGTQVRDLLALWFSYHNAMPQLSGLQITYDSSSPTQRTITNSAGASKDISDPIQNITDDQGNPILDKRNYLVVASDFLVTGGDGLGFIFGSLSPAPVINNQRKQRDVLVDYLKSKPAGIDYSNSPARLIDQSSDELKH